LEAVLDNSVKEIWFNVSIDGTEERQSEVRRDSQAGQLARETLGGAAMLRHKYRHLNVGILFTLTPDNVQDTREVVRLAEDLNVQLYINLLHEGEAYYNNTGENFPQAYRPIKDELARALAIGAGTRKGSSLTRWQRKLLHRYLAEDRKPPIRCFSGTSSAFLTPYGDVYPCVPARRSFLMGNLRESPLEGIWNSPQAKSVRRAIRQSDCKCLLTCELANNLKYHFPYQLRRSRKIVPFLSEK